MSNDNRAKSLSLTLAHEGLWSNNPKDPGGPTMKGVTQKVYSAYLVSKGQDGRKSVRGITDAELLDIYGSEYMDPVHFDDLPKGLDYAVFDFGVNSGPGKAIKVLQKLLRVPQDGKWGLITSSALAGVNDLEGLIVDYCAARMSFLKSLKTFGTFGAGWTRRVEGDFDGVQDGDRGVVDFAAMMARGDRITKPMTPAAIGDKDGELNAKAPPTQVAVTKTPTGKGIIATAGGIGATAVATATNLANQAQTAGNAVQTGAAAAVQVHHATHSVLTTYGHLAVDLLLGGGFVAAAGGCAFFGWQYYKHMKEQGQ